MQIELQKSETAIAIEKSSLICQKLTAVRFSATGLSLQTEARGLSKAAVSKSQKPCYTIHETPWHVHKLRMHRMEPRYSQPLGHFLHLLYRILRIVHASHMQQARPLLQKLWPSGLALHMTSLSGPILPCVRWQRMAHSLVATYWVTAWIHPVHIYSLCSWFPKAYSFLPWFLHGYFYLVMFRGQYTWGPGKNRSATNGRCLAMKSSLAFVDRTGSPPAVVALYVSTKLL